MFASGWYRPQIVNIVLANLLLFTTSVIMSMGVFTVPIETAAPELKAVWTSGLGLADLLCAPAISLMGFVLDTRNISVHDAHIHPITVRLRKLAFPISALYFTLLLAIPAINLRSPTLLRLSALLLSIPNGVAYIVAIENLLAWMPKTPGLAMTFVSAGFGLSQSVLSPMLVISIALEGICVSVVMTAFVSFVLTYISVRFLSFPTYADQAAIGAVSTASDLVPDILVCSTVNEVLTWRALLKMPQFYLYVFVTFTGRTAHALFPYYFKLGNVFGLSTSFVVMGFQVLSLVGILYAFAGNVLLDRLSSPNKCAVRPLLAAVFLVQAALFLCLIPISHASNGPLALLVISCLIIMLESQTAFSVILARDIFGMKNSALIFGVVGGLSIGFGVSFFVLLMSAIEKAGGDGKSTPRTFVNFYPLAATSCVVGALGVMAMRRRFTACR